MYVIGEVESEWNWTAVYYNDPITIGMMQWYGTRAAALLNRIKTEMPSAYGMLAASLRSSIEAHDASDSYWTRRYLTQEEGNSIITVFKSEENHVIQEKQAIADFEGYISLLESWGMSQSNPKPLIFAMSMYHQSPSRAGIVMQTAGGSATLERIYTVCMNDSVLGHYRNRYNTVYSRLKAWDGESDPPDFGQTGNVSAGGDSGGITTEASQVGYILQMGNDLILYGRGVYANGVVFHAAGAQRWINGYNANGTEIVGGNTGGGSATGSEGQRAVVALYTSWVGKFKYSQAPGRLDPLSSGYGDCSSTIWFAYHQACGIDVGTFTEPMEEKGRLIAEGSGANLPIDRMELGDLLLCDWNGGKFDHVEMYIGNNQLCGHGGPGYGPTIKDNAQSYASRARRWMVRRYL